VVVFVLVTRLTDGDSAFSSLPGSAWTVTLMRQGLAPPPLGVLMTMDFEGDENIISDVSSFRLCLFGDVVRMGSFGVNFRADALLSSNDKANGSGLES
jgi:hypothetical protein